MAVELHQSALTSSDAAFAAEVFVAVPALVLEIDAVRSGASVTLSWPPVTGYRLYAADNVEGPYTPLLTGGNPVTTELLPPTTLGTSSHWPMEPRGL